MKIKCTEVQFTFEVGTDLFKVVGTKYSDPKNIMLKASYAVYDEWGVCIGAWYAGGRVISTTKAKEMLITALDERAAGADDARD